MSKQQSKSKMMVVHSAFGASKPIAPFIHNQTNTSKQPVDPSSCFRTDRYPIPTAAEYRSVQGTRM